MVRLRSPQVHFQSKKPQGFLIENTQPDDCNILFISLIYGIIECHFECFFRNGMKKKMYQEVTWVV